VDAPEARHRVDIGTALVVVDARAGASHDHPSRAALLMAPQHAAGVADMAAIDLAARISLCSCAHIPVIWILHEMRSDARYANFYTPRLWMSRAALLLAP